MVMWCRVVRQAAPKILLAACGVRDVGAAPGGGGPVKVLYGANECGSAPPRAVLLLVLLLLLRSALSLTGRRRVLLRFPYSPRWEAAEMAKRLRAFVIETAAPALIAKCAAM